MSERKNKFENKQIAVQDIIRLSNMLEEYKGEWLKRASLEQEYNDMTKKDEELKDDITVKLNYDITYKDGRTKKESSYEWFKENIENIELIKYVYINFSLYYYDNSSNYLDDQNSHTMSIELNFAQERYNLDDSHLEITTYSKNMEVETDVLYTQLNNLKSQIAEDEIFNIRNILKFARILESYKQEWLQKKEIQEKSAQIKVDKKNKYDGLNSYVEYNIVWYDGKDKSERDQKWFLDNLESTIKDIKRIYISYHLSFFDYTNNGMLCTLSSSCSFYLGDDNYDSNTRYSVDSSNMEQEADNLYSKITNVFRDNAVRYDKTIKNRNLRMQSFCIALGIALSYILYIVLKVLSGNFPDFFVNLLANKNVIIFGQWMVAIIAGNVFGLWYMNSLYKPLLPNRKFIGYNANKRESIYKDMVDEYKEDSELQFGKFYDLKARREKIEKIFKYSSIIVLIQVVISIILFLVLK